MSNAYSIARLRKALVHFVGGRVVQALARVGVVLLVVRLLPAADYGAYMLILGISEMLLLICSLGILPTGQRYLPQLVESATARDTSRFVLGITALQFLALGLMCGALWLMWDTVLPYLNFSPAQIQAARPAVLLFLLVPAMRFLVELLQSLMEQGRAQIVATLVPIGRIAGIGALLAAGTGITLETMVLLDAGVTTICVVLGVVLMMGRLRHLTDPEDPKPLPVREMTRHGWHMAAVQLLSAAHSPGALRMVIANALGIVESGLFAFLQSLQRLVGRYLPGALLRGLVRPMLVSRAHLAGGMDRLEHVVGLLFKTNLMLVAAGAVAVFIGGDRIVAIASGGKFNEAGNALLLMFLVLGVSSQRLVVDMLLQILDLTRVLRAASVLVPITLLAVWLCADFGLEAAIAASAMGIALVNVFCMWRLRAHTGRFRVDWWGMGSIILPSMVAALFGSAVRDILGVWFAIAAAGALLAVLLVAAKPFASGELMMVDRALGGLARRVMQPFSRKAVA